MKYFTGVILLLINLSASAQNYSFLNSGTKKLFVSSIPPYNAYSIAFDSALNSGNDTAYYNFLLGRTLPMQVPSNCPFWGGGCVMMRDLPSWIGNPIEYVSTGAFRFYNINGDTLNFDLNLNIGDTSVFYKDSFQVLKIVFETTDTINVFGNLDSANFYRIVHTDTSGNIISSALNQQQVIVAKDNGLIQFFKVDSFPQVLIPLTIAGNNFPQGGLTALTSEMIYDYQPGDEIQTKYYTNTLGGPPWLNYTSYTKLTFISRVDLPDSIIYLAYSQSFNQDSASSINDTVQFKYFRHDTIASIPFEFYDESGRQRSLSLKDYCGQYLWTYQVYSPNDMIYCVNENCYGGIDVFSSPYRDFIEFVAGLGIYMIEITPILIGQSGYTHSYNKIIYFKKNGIPCGQELFVGINEPELANENIKLFPNPAENLLYIKLQNANTAKNNYLITNLLGTINTEGIITDNETTLNISQLENGIYFIRIFSNDKTVVHKKFIKAN